MKVSLLSLFSLLLLVGCDDSIRTRSTIPASPQTNQEKVVADTKAANLEKGFVCELKLLEERKIEKVFLRNNPISKKVVDIFRYDEQTKTRSGIKTISDGNESSSLFFESKGDDLFETNVALVKSTELLHDIDESVRWVEMQVIYDARLDEYNFTRMITYKRSDINELQKSFNEYAVITNCDEATVNVLN